MYLFEMLRIKNTRFTIIYSKQDFDCNIVTQICVLYFDEKLSSGSYSLHVKYLSAINNTENIFISLQSVHANSSRLLTWSGGEHFQAIGAQRLFPCWDEPTIKTTFNISIKHYYNYKVFSNTPIEKEITKAYMKRTFFKIIPEMPTYLVTVAISSVRLIRDTYKTNTLKSAM